MPASLPLRALAPTTGGRTLGKQMPDTGPRGSPRTDSASSRISLADAAPGLSAFLAADERFVLEQISVPLVHVSNGSVPVGALLERRAAFGAIIVEGLVLNELAVGDEPALWILGPGDVIAATDGLGPTVAARSGYRARASTRLALLAGDFLTAVRREPRVLIGLQAAVAEQLERVVTQLAICQMPRVADRVHAMLWLLADSFGRVSTAGTRVPLSLTHEMIGAPRLRDRELFFRRGRRDHGGANQLADFDRG